MNISDAPSLRESPKPWLTDPLFVAELSDLTDDAKAMLGGMFGIGQTSLVFGMRESRPTARAQAALDELVEKHVLWREPYNQSGGVQYKPMTPLGRQAFTWIRSNADKCRWPVAEPIKPETSQSNRKDGSSLKTPHPITAKGLS